MAFSPGMCPHCEEFILMKDKVPFLVCPLCSENVLARDGAGLLDELCADPKLTNAIIAQCIKIEQEFGPELPLQVILKLCENFPENEQAAYLAISMSGFTPVMVEQYLTAFADNTKEVPFAVDFLEGALKYRNLRFAALFRKYIDSKLSGNVKTRWVEQLTQLSSQYTGKELTGTALYTLYGFYIVSTLINAGVAIAFFFLRWQFLVGAMAVGVVLCIEIFTLYFHNKKFGNRSLIGDTERVLMVMFMCSLVVIVGGAVIGAARR
jgi:hypothetical protein